MSFGTADASSTRLPQVGASCGGGVDPRGLAGKASQSATRTLLPPTSSRFTANQIFPRTASLFEAYLSLPFRLVRSCPIQWMHVGCRAFPLGVAIWVSSSVVRISRRPAPTHSRRKPPLDNRDSRGARHPYFTPSNSVDWRLARVHLGQRPSQTISSA